MALLLFFLTFAILAGASLKPSKAAPDPETLFQRGDLLSAGRGAWIGEPLWQAMGLGVLLLVTLLWLV